jgi:hypothetical protein
MEINPLFIIVCAMLCLTAPMARAFPPYHDIADTPAAQAEARQRNLPLAYLGGFSEDLTVSAPDPGTAGDLAQMALATLQGRAVVIFFDGHNMGPVPAIIHAQYHIHDDGPLDGTAAWLRPKVVFSNADITRILGRVSWTQMSAGRDTPLNSALQKIETDPTALVPAPPPPPLLPDSTATDNSNLDNGAPESSLANTVASVTGLTNQSLYQIGGGILAVALLFLVVSRLRR